MVWLHPLLVLGACFVPQLSQALEASSAKASDSKVEPDLVVVAYNSKEKLSDTLVYDSIDEHTSDESKAKINLKLTTVGEGLDLWKRDDDGNTRGWMFRLRHTIKEVMEEYKRRNEQDFVVLMVDALDVYVPKTFEADSLERLLRRFLTDFAGHKIVFPGQIYCCNPWELRTVARRDWDKFWHSKEDGTAPPSMFKHLNAGIFMGYASAILEMADEMNLWEKTYHNHESYHSLMAVEDLRMIDLETDDDEWQLAAWFFEDQSKAHPLSSLDYNQELFAVTGTFRAIQRDNGFEVFSREHFDLMFGELPEKHVEFEDLTICPYVYDAKSGSWINVLTGSTPLVFHFAGNDWLCACEIFRADDYKTIPPKFRKSCEENHYDNWRGRVELAILHVAHSADPTEELFLMDDANESTLKVIGGKLQDEDLNRFQLDAKTVHRMLDDNPYIGTEDTAPVNPVLAFLGSIVSTIFFCL